MLRITSTSNISLDYIRKFQSELSPTFDLEIEEGQFFYKSLEHPSWVTFIAEADWWIKAFAAVAALYIAEVIKEAAKHTWKSISNRFTSKVTDNDPINFFSIKTAILMKQLPPKSSVILALPIPDFYNSTSLVLLGTEIDDISIQIALFTHHLPELMKLIENEGVQQKRILGSIQLALQKDASLMVSWMDMDFSRHQRIIPFGEPV